MSDERLRELERSACGGDLDAHRRLHVERVRRGEQLPDVPRDDPWAWLKIAQGLNAFGIVALWMQVTITKLELNEAARVVADWNEEHWSAAAEAEREYRRSRSIYPDMFALLNRVRDATEAATQAWMSRMLGLPFPSEREWILIPAGDDWQDRLGAELDQRGGSWAFHDVAIMPDGSYSCEVERLSPQ